jgi:hypothetical protein
VVSTLQELQVLRGTVGRLSAELEDARLAHAAQVAQLSGEQQAARTRLRQEETEASQATGHLAVRLSEAREEGRRQGGAAAEAELLGELEAARRQARAMDLQLQAEQGGLKDEARAAAARAEAAERRAAGAEAAASDTLSHPSSASKEKRPLTRRLKSRGWLGSLTSSL